MMKQLTLEQKRMYQFLSARSKDGRTFTLKQMVEVTGYTENTVSTYIRKYLANLFVYEGGGFCIVDNQFLKKIPDESAYHDRVSQTHPSLRRRY